MNDPNLKEGTAQRVNVGYECKVNLLTDAPSGHSHIIRWIAVVEKDKVPHDLFTVDVIATILYEIDPSALSHLLDVQASQFYCWWTTNGHIKESESDKEFQSETVDTESHKSDDLSPDHIYLLRVENIVQVGIVSFASHRSDLNVTYAICEKGNWEIVYSEDQSQDEKYYPSTSSLDRREAHDHKLARIIIRGTDFEDKNNVPMGFHWACVLQNGAGGPKYSGRRTQNISNADRITEVSQQVQETITGSGGSSRFANRMSEVQGPLDRLQKSAEKLTSSLKRKRDD
ncbi:uncharacterized protein EAE97_006211 [Botrytis byssoidea]|uniref:Uncharacterized protein n=1 Tax=Botrytis byssoidea TaxID=139641 RepID=A0A9P5LUH4_9HELO|nr:uncharacterized protein EAE97_006211 [Botrytis byssoidea]KAF7942757.1 hypothetical protein EAE97_006211 [Botrytis byssoidea]